MGADLVGLGPQYDLAVSKTRQGIGSGIKQYCQIQQFDPATRRAQLAEINAAAAPYKMMALDCTGPNGVPDGLPDF